MMTVVMISFALPAFVCWLAPVDPVTRSFSFTNDRTLDIFRNYFQTLLLTTTLDCVILFLFLECVLFLLPVASSLWLNSSSSQRETWRTSPELMHMSPHWAQIFLGQDRWSNNQFRWLRLKPFVELINCYKNEFTMCLGRLYLSLRRSLAVLYAVSVMAKCRTKLAVLGKRYLLWIMLSYMS